MRSAKNISIRAVRAAQMQEWQERRSSRLNAGKAIEAEFSQRADTLFGWSDKAVGPDNLKTGRKTV